MPVPISCGPTRTRRRRGSCKGADLRFGSLDEIVDDYVSQFRPLRRDERRWHRSPKSLAEGPCQATPDAHCTPVGWNFSPRVDAPQRR